MTGALATAKAEQVAAGLETSVSADCVVIGCDSMLYIHGELCGKPPTVDEARARWRAMAGNSGQLYTGHSLIRLRDNEITHQVTETAVTTVLHCRSAWFPLLILLPSAVLLGVAVCIAAAAVQVPVRLLTTYLDCFR